MPGLQTVGKFLNKYRLPGVVAIGKYAFMPNDDIKLITVVGKAMQLPKIEKPSREEVSKWHAEYMKRVVQLFESHKGACAMEGAAAKLEVY